MGHRRDGSYEGAVNITPVVAETQKRANHACQQARRFGRPKSAGFLYDEIANRLSRQTLQVQPALRARSREEAMCDGGVHRTTRGSEAALVQQVSRKVLSQRVDLGLLTGLKCLRR